MAVAKFQLELGIILLVWLKCVGALLVVILSR